MSNQHPITPPPDLVPVSESLPGPEDCDDQGRCWLGGDQLASGSPTSNQHPIVPSAEQVDQLFDDAVRLNITPKYYIARQVSLWSADQELEACCEWLQDPDLNVDTYKLRAARRSTKPPSLKEQALAALNVIEDKMLGPTIEEKLIRKALEALPND